MPMRSLRSFLIERLLKRASNKHNFTDEKAYAKFLKKRQRVNDKPYALPRYLQKHFNIKKQYFDEMECGFNIIYIVPCIRLPMACEIFELAEYRVLSMSRKITARSSTLESVRTRD